MDKKIECKRIISRIISCLPLIDTLTYEQKQRLEEDIKYVFDNTPEEEKELLDKLKRALEEYKSKEEYKSDKQNERAKQNELIDFYMPFQIQKSEIDSLYVNKLVFDSLDSLGGDFDSVVDYYNDKNIEKSSKPITEKYNSPNSEDTQVKADKTPEEFDSSSLEHNGRSK